MAPVHDALTQDSAATQLNLRDQSLFSVPADITRLSNLRFLNVMRNHFEVWDEDILALTHLEVLNIRNNKIKAIPAGIASLPHLVRLDASANSIAVVPDEIGRLQALRFLHLSLNALTSIPTSIGSCRGSLKKKEKRIVIISAINSGSSTAIQLSWIRKRSFINGDYVHYNPVEAGIVLSPEHYLYSSAMNYAAVPETLMSVILI